ncbi:hypothetical protein Scep_015363 [Stephania cephalantha]|uniref:Pyruvate kinase n=1 Tax=Stephania cephalantha TaxID=152367 RepID=A0AAP0P0B0_9MAGN
MHSTQINLEEPIRMASILEPSKPVKFLSCNDEDRRDARSEVEISGSDLGMSQVGDVRLIRVILALHIRLQIMGFIKNCKFVEFRLSFSCLVVVARFDFSWGDAEYHQETLENLKIAIKTTKKLCAVMLDTVGPELQIVNNSHHPISLEADSFVVLTPYQDQKTTSKLLPINFQGLSKEMSSLFGYERVKGHAVVVQKGDTIFIGQYLFTGSENTSVWMEVAEVKGEEVICIIKNSATLAKSLCTIHVSQVRVDLPTLTDKDKEVREYVSSLGNLRQAQIFAKIENMEGLNHFDGILKEADGIILCRGHLGVDLPPEKVFLFQKAAIYKCNMAGKPAVVTRVVDTMTENLRPTRAEATDVANAVLDGCDAIFLGAETLRGLYPVESVSTVGRICSEVHTAVNVKASVIIVFTSSGRAARLIAKYKPTMPILSVVIPQIKSNQLQWNFTGAFEARQSLIVRGLFPMLADPRHQAESRSHTNESILKVTLDHGRSFGLIKPHDRVVVCQKIGDASVVKVLVVED